jgi:hypothetical protein
MLCYCILSSRKWYDSNYLAVSDQTQLLLNIFTIKYYSRVCTLELNIAQVLFIIFMLGLLKTTPVKPLVLLYAFLVTKHPHFPISSSTICAIFWAAPLSPRILRSLARMSSNFSGWVKKSTTISPISCG